MAEDRDRFKPFGYFLVTWLLLIYAGNRGACSSDEVISSSPEGQPAGWLSGVPAYGDDENDGV